MGDHQKSNRRRNKRRSSHRSDGGVEHQQQTPVSDGNSTLPPRQSPKVLSNNVSVQNKSQHGDKSTNQMLAGGRVISGEKPPAPINKQPTVAISSHTVSSVQKEELADPAKRQSSAVEAASPAVPLIQHNTAKHTNLCKNILVKVADVKTRTPADNANTPKKKESPIGPVRDTDNVNNEIKVAQLKQSANGDVKLENSLPSEKPKIPVENATAAPAKSKAELRAERRALQEAQRAAKQVKKDESKGGKASNVPASTSVGTKPSSHGVEPKKPTEVPNDKTVVTKVPDKVKSMTLMNVKLFSHLPAYERKISVIQAAKEGIHPAIVRLGLQYAEGIVCGSNARCTALIHAFLEVFRDFKTPESKDLSHALTSLHIEPSMRFLGKCRPVSVGMRVICKKIVEEVTNLPKELSEEEAKKKLVNVLQNILEDDIIKAHVSIVNLAKEKITSDDVILTYGCSYIVKEVLTAAHQTAKFHVIIVDSRPKLEGRSMLHYLTQQGIQCTYVLINAVAHAMKEATKVFLGAHALLANGYVMSRVGSSQVALVAKAFNKPVLVCCETYKFSELVQTDSIVFNELGNPDDLVDTHRDNNPLSGWQDMKTLNILNLYYDFTPPDLVTVIINDAHLVPCTSVPVLLRVKPTKR